MKKYNLSTIMKRAWELVKRAGMTISSGLKKAWEEAKHMGEYNLKGTEKQIAWAKDIIAAIETVFHEIEIAYADHPRMEIIKQQHQIILNNMKNEYAGNIIRDLSDFLRYLKPNSQTLEEKYKDIFGYIDTALFLKKRNYRLGITK